MKIDLNKLQLAMANACVDRKDLQARSGLPLGTLSNVYNGKNVRTSTIGKIARALEVSAESIVVSEHTQQDDRNKLVDRLTGIEQELKTIKNELI